MPRAARSFPAFSGARTAAKVGLLHRRSGCNLLNPRRLFNIRGSATRFLVLSFFYSRFRLSRRLYPNLLWTFVLVERVICIRSLGSTIQPADRITRPRRSQATPPGQGPSLTYTKLGGYWICYLHWLGRNAKWAGFVYLRIGYAFRRVCALL